MAFGGTVKLTGESEYKKALADITGNLKVLNSEMKVVTSQYDRNDKSTEALSSKNEVLNKKIDEQKQKVDVLSKALADAEQETGKNSSTSQKWQIELNNAQAELNKLVKEVGDNEKAMEQSADATEENAESVEKFGKEADDSGKKALSLGDIIKANLISEGIMSGLSALGGAIAGIGQKFGAFLDLADSTKETQTAMSKLEASFESAGHDIDFATDTVYALTGVLGDMDRSVEASNLLAKMSTDSEDLEANTRILAGVFAEFGDSIPTEGLAEGMNATAEMGSVQGVLADALEWQGVNLDEYNAKLESMTSAEERASYIQSTLTDLYGASADAYRENNQALIESNEAQLRYEQNLADMGALALPLQTSIQNISSNLLMSFRPALEEVMPSLQGLGSAFTDLIKAVTMGDEGGIETALATVSENVTLFVESLGETLPMVGDLVMSLLETILQVIADNLPLILEQGAILLTSLLDGISQNIGTIMPIILTVIQTVITTLLQNLPTILQMGIQLLVSLIQGIAQSLPEIIPVIISSVVLMVETLLDNIDLIIDAGIDLILALADGLIDALPDLVDKIPVIITKLIDAIVNNLPKLIEMGITLIIKLAVGLVQAIPQLIAKIPEIITALINGFGSFFSKVGEIGKNIIDGIKNGISNAWNNLKEWFKGLFGDIIGIAKKILGIASPSKVFKEIGGFTAEGFGEGFTDTMEDVNRDIADAIPTEFDADIHTNINGAYSSASSGDNMVSAFKKALTGVKVVMNNREMGAFVTETVAREVFA
jgi:phage-related protein